VAIEESGVFFNKFMAFEHGQQCQILKNQRNEG